jgi:hypothetical protein
VPLSARLFGNLLSRISDKEPGIILIIELQQHQIGHVTLLNRHPSNDRRVTATQVPGQNHPIAFSHEQLTKNSVTIPADHVGSAPEYRPKLPDQQTKFHQSIN